MNAQWAPSMRGKQDPQVWAADSQSRDEVFFAPLLR